MGTIGIGIGHDNDLVIVGIFNREVCSDTRSDGINHGVDFLIFKDIRHLSLGCIDYLTTKRQDSLELTVTTLLGRTDGRVPLDQIEFILCRVFRLSWSQFSRQQALVFLVFLAISALITRLTSCFTSITSLDSLADEIGSKFSIFHKEEGQLISHNAIHNRTSKWTPQFVLSLAFKLKVFFRNQDRKNGC